MSAGTRLPALALPLLLACGGEVGPGSESAAPLVKPTPIAFTRVDGDYDASLELDESRGLMSLRVAVRRPSEAGALPMARRVEMWRPLVEEMLRTRGRRKEYLVAVGEYPELGGRLAVAAICSGRWDLRTGRPHSGEPGAAVAAMLADGSLTPELRSLFEPLSYALSASSAEKVLLCRWKEIPSQPPSPCPSDVAPESQVPCGASILYRITSRH